MPGSTLSFAEVMHRGKGHTNGFDYLRIGLALSVLVVHVTYIADISAWKYLWTSWTGPFELSILPAFFVLSGFLVAGSLVRNSIPQFLALRALRIFPALAVEILLSAFVLGMCVTTLPIRSYLASAELHTYFFNMIGYIHYQLPGVFGGRFVNLQLWTIPFELECYIGLVTLCICGFIGRRRLFAGVLVFASVGMTLIALHHASYKSNWNVPGRMLVLAFLFGVAIYLFRTKLPHSKLLFSACAVATYGFLRFPDCTFLAAAPLAYITAYIGLLRLKPIPFGDLSYGVYLFHFPIARTLFEVTGQSMPWEMLLLFTLVLTTLFAALSWNLIERPLLNRKPFVLARVAIISDWSARKLQRFLLRGVIAADVLAVDDESP